MRTYAEVRTELAGAKLYLEDRAYLLERTKIGIEADAIEAVNGIKNLGPNEKAQERTLDVIIHNDSQYKEDFQAWRKAHREVTQLQAELDCILFAMREREASIKEQMIVLELKAS